MAFIIVLALICALRGRRGLRGDFVLDIHFFTLEETEGRVVAFIRALSGVGC